MVNFYLFKEYDKPVDLPTKVIPYRNKQKNFQDLYSCPNLKIVKLP